MAKDVLSLAWSDMKHRRFATAIRRLEARSDIYGENFEFFQMLGTACLYVGDIGSAYSYYEKARKIKLTDSRLLLGQAAIFLRRGDTDRALEYYLQILENDPSNKIAMEAMEFIRTRGDNDTICRWVDSGRIEQFYPPIGINPVKLLFFVVPILIGLATLLFINISIHQNVPVENGRVDLSKIVLSDDEKNSPKETDLSTQSYKYIFSPREINQIYNNAITYFNAGRDNACQIEINTLLNSNARLSIKQKANVLLSYLEIPDFDSIRDVPSVREVQLNSFNYVGCWVDWGGKISNAQIYDNNSYSCDLLIGDNELNHYEGTVRVYFKSVPDIQPDLAVKILGQISIQDGEVIVLGRAVYQSVYSTVK